MAISFEDFLKLDGADGIPFDPKTLEENAVLILNPDFFRKVPKLGLVVRGGDFEKSQPRTAPPARVSEDEEAIEIIFEE